MALLQNLLQIIAPKKKPSKTGVTITPDYLPQQKDNVLALPQFTAFRSDILTDRQSNDSRVLLKTLFRQDPDVSATVNGYLTLANTDMIFWAEDVDGAIDPDASATLHSIVKKLTRQLDYTVGFQFKQSLSQLNADLRYMLLLRGGIGQELIFDKTQNPESLRMIDMSTMQFYEKVPGDYKPAQLIPGQGLPQLMDTPTIFISFYRRDPTTIYSDSTFVAAINTIAARQQVINDLYRIMQLTGYPRMEVKVLEEIVRNNAPANIKADGEKMKTYVADQISTLSASFTSIRVDQAVVHTDAVELGILNGRNPGMAIDISSIVETLNAQNQAGLKTMSTILGRGASGVNTGSVEARLAAMYADELNEPLAEMWSRVLSFCLHMQGYQGFAQVQFRDAELRPSTELEPQLVMKATRLRQDLSDGILTDEEYTLEMYGRLPQPGAPPLSGTGFMTPVPAGGIGDGSSSSGTPNPADVSPKQGPLNRAISPDRTKMTKANPKKSSKPGA